MALRVVGAGLGRTGTNSLKLALEQLLGGRCYHMFEVFENEGHVAVWERAMNGEPPEWNEFLAGFTAAVDWPVAAFWRELAAANPDALVLLSVRDADVWWASASTTIFAPELVERLRVDGELGWPYNLVSRRFTPRFQEEAAAKRAYLEHCEAVRREVPPERLLEWRPGDGWEPICAALGLPVPGNPFPHVNTEEEFRAHVRLDAAV